ncbi:MAG: phospholipid/cholesterol/gamma-HCH transport system substrate-binding protein [Pseudonocardiales bacterium]|jgi:phospholipid/cholesterol/gamma-HCH transport system substrate-binding protein|nr:phospholipid/cholesterol/gamma-HCH transport system substrate-binding protein [Pseudonocardiales bacterium]
MSDSSYAADRPSTSTGPVKTRRTNVGGKPFSARNPVTIGAVGLVIIGVLLWAAFNASKLPIIGGGTTYTAFFTEDAGLRSNDDVRVAGVKVGTVSSASLDGNKVKVKFKVKNAFIGDQSTIAIKLKTLLGAKYLGIDSIGSKKQDSKTPIGLDRTTSPFDIYPAFTGLTQTIDKIDTNKLSQAFGVLATAFTNTPATVKPVLTGLSRLSNTIASRDQALRTLLSQANVVTKTLADRSGNLQQLLQDGSLLLDELNNRRDAIHSLLVNTSTLATQLEGLVADNQKTIGPMLDNLHGVLQLLQDNQDSLDRSLQMLAPFYRVFSSALGSGRWFDNYICNLGAGGITDILLLGNGDGGCKG